MLLDRPRGPVPLTYPTWVAVGERYNLRWVDRDLLVGAVDAPDYAAALGLRRIVALTRYGVDVAGVPTLRRPFEDGTAFPPGVLDAVLAFVAAADGPVLVHCHAGLSRSVSCAYALLRRRGLGHQEALARVRVPGYGSFPMVATLASARRWAEGV